MATLTELNSRDCLELFDEYCSQVRMQLIDENLADDILSHYLEECEKERVMSNQKFEEEGYEELIKEHLEIPSYEVLSYMKARMADGTLDIPKLDNSHIHQLMERQGFTARTSKDGLMWIKY